MKTKYLKTHTQHTLSISFPWEHRATQIVCAGLFILGLIYLYLVLSSILNVMAQREATVRSQHIQNSISSLEGTYFALARSVTQEDGIALGMTPIDHPLYVTRPGIVGSIATQANGAL